jgi:hypothetical protein
LSSKAAGKRPVGLDESNPFGDVARFAGAHRYEQSNKLAKEPSTKPRSKHPGDAAFTESVTLPKTKSAHGERRQTGKKGSGPRTRAAKVHRPGRSRQQSSEGHAGDGRSQCDTDDTAQSTPPSVLGKQKAEVAEVEGPFPIDDLGMHSDATVFEGNEDEWYDEDLATSAAKSDIQLERSAAQAAKPPMPPKAPSQLKPPLKRTVREPESAEDGIRDFKGHCSKSRAEHHNAVQDHSAKTEPPMPQSSITPDHDTRYQELSRIMRGNTKDPAEAAARAMAPKGVVPTEELANEDLIADKKVEAVIEGDRHEDGKEEETKVEAGRSGPIDIPR